MLIKSASEIELIRRSGRVLKKVLDGAIKKIAPGITTREINLEIEKIIIQNNTKASFKNFQGYKYASCISINNQLVHGLPSNRKIKTGDLVSIDAGVSYHGYHTDAARTIIVGKTTKDKKRLVQATKEALDLAIKNLRHEVKLNHIQSIIENHALKHKLGVVKTLTGHGIGQSLQEPPVIANFYQKGNSFTFKKNMTVCIEPMFNLGSELVEIEEDGWTVRTKDGKACAHFEDTILITQKGAEVLTR